MKLVIIIVIAFVLLIPSNVFAETKSFTVDAGSLTSFRLNLNSGDIVTGSFSVGGGSGNDIEFHITGPAGGIIYPETLVRHGTDFQFTAQKNGSHTMFFSNGMSLLSDKIVTLSYEIDGAYGGGCLIATATYDSELAPQVQLLRELRDNSLLQTKSGTSFMSAFNDVYYSFSPYIADYERENHIFKELVKVTITPLISSLSILNYVDMDSEESVLGYGISLIILNMMMYVGIPVLAIMKIRK